MSWCDVVSRVLSYSSSICKGEEERTLGTRLIGLQVAFSRGSIFPITDTLNNANTQLSHK